MSAPPSLAPAAPSHFALRMWVFFAGYLLVGGVTLPFFPVWLEARGLSDVEIAQVIALPTLIRVFLTPLAGMYADWAPNRRFAVISFTLPAVIVFLLAWPANGFRQLLITTGIAYTLLGLANPPAEALALTGVRRFGADYGRMRMGGSVAFIFANLGSGALLGIFNPDAIFFLILGAMICAALVSFTLPVTPPAVRALDDAAKPDTRPSREVLGNRAFLTLLVATSLIGGSHALLYSFGSIEWHRLGFSSFEIGAFWAFSLVCEIAVFAFAKPLLARFGAYQLLIIGAVAAIARWLLFPLMPEVGFLGFAITQAFHGLTFGANYLGIQQLITRHIPDGMTASAQGIFAMILGLSMAVFTSLAGPIYQAFGIYGFTLMAPVAGVALVMLIAVRRFATS